jgi:hypothetical protein
MRRTWAWFCPSRDNVAELYSLFFGIANLSLDVRFGSKADIGGSVRNVRFTPESGHRDLEAGDNGKGPNWLDHDWRPGCDTLDTE